MKEYLSQFDKYLKKDRAWNFDGNLSYVRESNVSNAPKERTYGGLEFEPPRKAHGVIYDVSAQKNTPIKGHWVWKKNLSAGGKFYWDAHAYDDLTIRAETGAGWRNHEQEISLSPFYENVGMVPNRIPILRAASCAIRICCHPNGRCSAHGNLATASIKSGSS